MSAPKRTTLSRYAATGMESEFEPGSRGRVLRNLLGIRLVREMQLAESRALDAVQYVAMTSYASNHRFSADDILTLHRLWLGGIYEWAGTYRSVNVSKGGFAFAAASQVPRLMSDFSRNELQTCTPCAGMDVPELVRALARTHAELVLIHPFREGNGRCARLLALLMATQAGLPGLDFSNFARRGKLRYIASIHAALDRNYEPLEERFREVIARTLNAYPSAGTFLPVS